MSIHKKALQHLYEFAGKLRTVNLSKGGFMFPAAQFLSNGMQDFQTEILSNLKDEYSTKEELIEAIAKVHGELLYIHPFREGNGRTARMLANLMSYKASYERLKFEKLDNEEMFNKYIEAVQKVGQKKYQPMIEIITYVF
jgi:cell filamentation protein